MKQMIQPQVLNVQLIRGPPKPLPIPNLSLGYTENCAHVVIKDPLPFPVIQNFNDLNDFLAPSFNDPLSICPDFDDLKHMFEPLKNLEVENTNQMPPEDEWPSFVDLVNESSVELGHW